MSVDYIAGNTTDGLTLKLYRGEDMVLLAFDIADSLKKPDFVDFGIQYFLGDGRRQYAGQAQVEQLPRRCPVPFGPAALTKDLPEPFKAERTGGGGIHMHNKFVACDFNGSKPVVFTG